MTFADDPNGGTVRELLRRADADGISVVTSRLPGELLGCYVPGEARIYLDLRLTPIEQRSVLAHELGHVRFGHGLCRPRSARESARMERQADLFAARLLIDHRGYVAAARVSQDPETLAEALGVTVELLDVYRRECTTSERGLILPRAA
ncbi:MAG: ImmA/IrrE family metallo-endopeptidase [Microbacterium sp.]